jgi:hypothetical protein
VQPGYSQASFLDFGISHVMRQRSESLEAQGNLQGVNILTMKFHVSAHVRLLAQRVVADITCLK